MFFSPDSANNNKRGDSFIDVDGTRVELELGWGFKMEHSGLNVCISEAGNVLNGEIL